MFHWLKKHFIPHAGNEHRPHILRDESIRNVVAIVIFLEIFSFLIPTLTQLNFTGGMAAVLPAVLSALTNDERQTQSLSTLKVNPILNKAAEMKATDMATRGYFAHTSPEGKTPWYWLELVGYKYQYAGENLAVNFSDSKDVTLAWLASPTHRANIVKGNYTEIGTGIAHGMYKGKETVFVAQVYANPIFIKTETQPPLPAKETNIPKVSVKTELTNVLGAEAAPSLATVDNQKTESAKEPAFWQKLLASPRSTTNIIFYIISGVIILALLLYIFIKMRNHHKDIITNGLVLLAVIGAICVANYYFSSRQMVILQSFDYSNENK